MPRSFNPEELCKLLKYQKFIEEPQNATSHLKYTHPTPQIVPKGTRPFIIVILKKGNYDPNTSASYRTQLRRLGIPNEAIKKILG